MWSIFMGFPVAQWWRIRLPMQEIQVQSLAQEEPLQKERQPTPVFLPGVSHGQRSLVGYSLWGCKESDTTEHIHTKRIQKAKSHLVPRRAAVHRSEQMWVKSPHSWPRVGVLLLRRLVVPKQIKQEGQAEDGGDVLYLYMIHLLCSRNQCHMVKQLYSN